MAMRCPNCNNKVPEGKRFCGYCGYRLVPLEPGTFDEEAPTKLAPPRVEDAAPPPAEPAEAPPEILRAAPEGLPCPACGAQNRLGAQFCDRCGADLVETVAKAVPEQRSAPEKSMPVRGRVGSPLLLMIIGWACAHGAGQTILWFYGDYVQGRINIQMHYRVPYVIAAIIAGGIAGLVTGVVLRQLEPSVQTGHACIVFGGWVAAYLLSVMLYQAYSQPLIRSRLYEVSPTLFSVSLSSISATVVTLIGGLVTGLVLRWSKPRLRSKRVLVTAGIWTVAAGVGVSLGAPLAGPGGLLAAAVNGALRGTGGYGALQWQLKWARREAQATGVRR
jgi:hypothetical protein